jgi:hypothetical protein
MLMLAQSASLLSRSLSVADILDEQFVTLENACKFIPGLRPGKNVNRSTIYRWSDSGVRGVRLETIQVGGRRMTTHEAIKRFIMEMSKPERIQEVKQQIVSRLHSPKSERKRKRALAAKAGEKLRKAGAQ